MEQRNDWYIVVNIGQVKYVKEKINFHFYAYMEQKFQFLVFLKMRNASSEHISVGREASLTLYLLWELNKGTRDILYLIFYPYIRAYLYSSLQFLNIALVWSGHACMYCELREKLREPNHNSILKSW